MLDSKGMIRQLQLEEMPRKLIPSSLGRDDDILDPESDCESLTDKAKSSHKKSRSQDQFSKALKIYKHRSGGAVMGSENDSGGAICREEFAEILKHTEEPLVN